MMKRSLTFLVASIVLVFSALGQVTKAPAYPLITHDPYFSIWSFNDTLNAATTRHWTGTDHSLLGLIKVDGNIYRFLGNAERSFKTLLAASDEMVYEAAYTETAPAADWMQPGFDASAWGTGQAPFGDNAGLHRTLWKSRNIWMRRTFTLDDLSGENLFLKLQHDDNAEVYLNGVRIYEHKGWLSKMHYFPMTALLKQHLVKGKNVLAIHVENTAGGAWLDAGIVQEEPPKGPAVQAAEQKSVVIEATQTRYQFACGPVNLSLTFTSPLLMNQLDLMARPVSYVTAQVKSADGRTHEVEVLLGASSDLAVNQPVQEVSAEATEHNGLLLLRAGTVEQPVLKKKGDDLRIDWGYLYAAAPKASGARQYISGSADAVAAFGGASPSGTKQGRKLMLNTVLPFGKVNVAGSEKFWMLGYDDLYSVQYFGTNLKPWWREKTASMEAALTAAAAQYKTVLQQCAAFNKKLYNDALQAGGEKYAQLCALVYRQTIAAHKLVKSPGGEILFLSKENYS
ncbi:MAG TPA: DUF5127 domain-containing protein, partial [Chitinophagaceae bacterium]|nr:DUF5127 domain-containing protein [Chitinophagaceae bacterium]